MALPPPTVAPVLSAKRWLRPGWLALRRAAAGRLGKAGRSWIADGWAVQWLSHPDQHTYAGYFDVTPFSKDSCRIFSLRIPRRQAHPDQNAEATISLHDLRDPEKPAQDLGTTTTWNWQQGCRLHWLGPDRQRHCLFNQPADGRLGCTILDTDSGGVVQRLPYPVYASAPDGTWALTTDFARLHRLRPGYGYALVPDATADEPAPAHDGIWRVSLKRDARERLLSVADIAAFAPQPTMAGAEHYINHLVINGAGTRFFFLHVWCHPGRKYQRLFTCNPDGSDLFLLTRGDYASHFCWCGADRVLAYASHPEAGRCFALYRDRSGASEVVGPSVLTGDGHPSLAPDGRTVAVDTLPDRLREQHLKLYDLESGRCERLARCFTPLSCSGPNRCDLHPRFSPDGKWIAVDTAARGHRALLLLRRTGAAP